ncbi:MAG TPA: glycosyltransferase [Algoriphagus sp.]|nr:glycosyltransferase [Algoriphagus sp.]
MYIDQTTLSEKSLLDLELDGNLNVFAMIGLFMEVKQMAEIITLFAKLPDLSLVLFGTGELQDSYQRKIQELGLKNVKIIGFVPSDQISKLYSQIDALIINSFEETGPMTGIEAMAAGKVIFSRPVGAMQERLNDPDLIFNSMGVLFEKVKTYSAFSPEKIIRVKTSMRTRYLENYSNIQLKKQIIDMVVEGKGI